jgi:hypothetical protein
LAPDPLQDPLCLIKTAIITDAQQIIHQPNKKQNPLLATLLDRDHENRTFQPWSCDGWRFFTEHLFLVVAGAALLL